MRLNFLKYMAPLCGVVFAMSSRGAVGTLSGPFVHDNLQVYLVHASALLEGRNYVTLSEALDRGFVVVRETGSVQELQIENVSKDTTVFLNAGDIVKGGRQDRTVRDDMVLPPMSGPVALPSFCVEHGRWSGRGVESPASFSSNTKALSSREEKLAARYGMSQSEVWASVDEQQVKLNDNVSRLANKPVDVRSPASGTSLQLALESKDLDAVKKAYLDKLGSLLNGKNDVIGFAYAINGEINSAEVYNNKALFRALWPKLIDAAITEAVTDHDAGVKSSPTTSLDVKNLFETALAGSVSEREVSRTTRVRIYSGRTTLLFETLDMDASGAWIHKSFINKGTQKVIVPLDR